MVDGDEKLTVEEDIIESMDEAVEASYDAFEDSEMQDSDVAALIGDSAIDENPEDATADELNSADEVKASENDNLPDKKEAPKKKAKKKGQSSKHKSAKSKEPPKEYKKLRAFLITFLVAALILVLTIAGFGIYGFIQLKPLKAKARTVKADVKSLVIAIAQNDAELAKTRYEKLTADNKKLRESVLTPYWKQIAKIPFAKDQINSAIELTHVLDDTCEQVFAPVMELVEKHPYKTVIQNGNINTSAILEYAGIINELSPKMSSLSVRMSSVDISLMDDDGKIKKYIDAFCMSTDFVNRLSGRITTPVIKQLLKYSPNEIKTQNGFDNEALKSYLSFVREILPEIMDLADYIGSMDLEKIDPDGEVKEYARDITKLSVFLCTASDKVIIPLLSQLDKCPLDNIKSDDGFNVIVLNEYLTFIEHIMPDFKLLSIDMGNLEFERVNADSLIGEYKAKLDQIVEIFDEGQQYLPLVHTLLGDGSDKFYFLGTQSTAEIRASGGFPGCVGGVTIENGLLRLDDFVGVYDVFGYGIPWEAKVTYQERLLFSGMPYPWDADFCPDFERVAKIWALAYEARMGKHVNGVISLTPTTIQYLLEFLGDIEISDGTVLNGENAAEYLQNTVYVKYQNMYSEENKNNDYVDALFSETAKKTMQLLVDGFNVEYMPEFLKVLNKGISERTIMFWFEDEEKQEVARQSGSNGGLNRDPMDPTAGVYFSLANASKMGYYLDIDIECSDGVENEDGSYSYDVEVKFTNIMTPKEASTIHGYITYGTGNMDGRMHFFAPAGGTVSEFKTSTWARVNEYEYSGLKLGYLISPIYAGQSITVNYKVTTAPGASKPLKFSTTPTLAGYRTNRDAAAIE